MVQYPQKSEVIYPANVPGLQKAWTYMTKDAIESSPVIDGTMVFIGSNDQSVYAFNLTLMEGNQHEQHD